MSALQQRIVPSIISYLHVAQQENRILFISYLCLSVNYFISGNGQIDENSTRFSTDLVVKTDVFELLKPKRTVSSLETVNFETFLATGLTMLEDHLALRLFCFIATHDRYFFLHRTHFCFFLDRHIKFCFAVSSNVGSSVNSGTLTWDARQLARFYVIIPEDCAVEGQQWEGQLKLLSIKRARLIGLLVQIAVACWSMTNRCLLIVRQPSATTPIVIVDVKEARLHLPR